MPVRVDATQATAKWLSRLQASTQQITDGVNRVTTAPGAAAAKQQQKWLARVTAAAQKWATNVGAVSLQSWQQSMIQTGIPRISQGAQAKQGKMQNFMNQFLPYLASGVQKIDAMPNTSLQDGINRAVAMIQYNAAFKRTNTGA